VIWGLNEEFFSGKYFIISFENRKNSIQKYNFKILIEITNNVFLKIEHLIHLTKKGKTNLTFLCLDVHGKKSWCLTNSNNIFE
jgi:hypothetical protein